MERYFPQRRTDLFPFPCEHISLDKNAEGSRKSGCFKCRKLLHRNKFNTYRYSKFFLNIYLTDSNTIFAWWEQLANFSRGKVCPGSMPKQSELNLMKFGTTSPQFSRKSDPDVEYRQSSTGSNCGILFCIQCSVDLKDSLPSCSFSRLKELGQILAG